MRILPIHPDSRSAIRKKQGKEELVTLFSLLAVVLIPNENKSIASRCAINEFSSREYGFHVNKHGLRHDTIENIVVMVHIGDSTTGCDTEVGTCK